MTADCALCTLFINSTSLLQSRRLHAIDLFTECRMVTLFMVSYWSLPFASHKIPFEGEKKESKHELRLNINRKVVLHQSVWYQCKSGTWKCDVMQIWFISRWLPRWSCLLGCCQWPGSMNASSIRCLYEILTQGGALVLWKNNPTRRWGLCMPKEAPWWREELATWCW